MLITHREINYRLAIFVLIYVIIMNIQYISDSKGQTTGVFIPIKEWDDIEKGL